MVICYGRQAAPVNTIDEQDNQVWLHGYFPISFQGLKDWVVLYGRVIRSGQKRNLSCALPKPVCPAALQLWWTSRAPGTTGSFFHGLLPKMAPPIIPGMEPAVDEYAIVSRR